MTVYALFSRITRDKAILIASSNPKFTAYCLEDVEGLIFESKGKPKGRFFVAIGQRGTPKNEMFVHDEPSVEWLIFRQPKPEELGLFLINKNPFTSAAGKQ